MHNEFRFLGLAPLFGAVGAMATVAAWHVYAILFLELVPAHLAILWCFLAGLAGPALVWLVVLIATRPGRRTIESTVRRPASVGLGLVIAAELGFYVPLGFIAIAFH
jgi:hypothetical protein